MSLPTDPPRRELPPNPSLEHLKKQAKRLAKSRNIPLAEAQHQLANDYGQKSWPRLKSHIESLALVQHGAVVDSGIRIPSLEIADAFLIAATPDPNSDHKSGTTQEAQKILSENPNLRYENFYVACALGDPGPIYVHLQKSPALAVAPGGPRNWLPLLYLTFSRFLRTFPHNNHPRFFYAAKLLLDNGADPNSHFTMPNNPNEIESALYGVAGLANNPDLTTLLLQYGANPNDHESLYHAAEFADNAALKVLLPAITKPDWVSYCMCHKMDMEDPAGLQLFLDHKADPNLLLGHGQRKGDRPLHFALIRHRSPKTIQTLLENGADPNLANTVGITPYQLALKLGNLEAAKVLLEHGAKEDATPKLRLLAAISAGDSGAVHQFLGEHPGVLAELTDEDHALLIDAAESGNEKAVALMLGPPFHFPVDIRKPAQSAWDGTPLHHACFYAQPHIVQLLLRHHADPHLTHSYGGNALTTTMHAAIHNDPADLPAHLQTLTHVAGYFAKGDLEKALATARTEGNAVLEEHLRGILQGRQRE